VADATLRFEFSSARWEYAVSDPSTWANLTEVTPLLQIARSSTGKPLGFVLDHEADAPEFTASLIAVERDFGIDIADRVRTAPDTDMEMLISTPGSLATKGTEEIEVMRPSNRLQAASSEVVITDDSITGVVTVTMTVPWWARFSKPWVAVRRRGKRDILLTGPLRVRGTTARATLRYGMPYSGSTLTADVVKGPRTFPWIRVVAALLALSVVGMGLVWNRLGDDAPVASQILQAPLPFFRVDELTPQGACSSFGDKVVAVGLEFDVDAGKPIVFGAYADVPQPDDFRLLTSRVLSETTMEIEIPSPSLFGDSDSDPTAIWLVWSYGDDLNMGGPRIARNICD